MTIININDSINKRKGLSKKQKEMAMTVLTNELNDVMASVEILEEEMAKTAVFNELDLRALVINHMSKKLKQNPDGTIDEKLLQHVYRWYFPE